MSYNFIVINQDRPDKAARSLYIPRLLFWFFLFWTFVLPFCVYYVSYHYVAPRVWVPQAHEMEVELIKIRAEVADLRIENERLVTDYQGMFGQSQEDEQQRMAAETKVEISENARITATSRLQELEDQVFELQQALSFYEAFVKPAADDNELQCFNIKINRSGDRVDYSVNFLRNSQKEKNKINATVKMRILSGRNVLTLEGDKDEVLAPDRMAKLSMTKDKVLKGKILAADLSENGLNVLDIKAYDGDNKVLAHCWKAF